MPGLGALGGFKMQVEDRAGHGPEALYAAMQALMGRAAQEPALAGMLSSFDINVPQLTLDVDRERAKALGIPLHEVYDALQIHLGPFVQEDATFGARVRVGVRQPLLRGAWGIPERNAIESAERSEHIAEAALESETNAPRFGSSISNARWAASRSASRTQAGDALGGGTRGGPSAMLPRVQGLEYTFLFADLAGYTALTEAHGDEGGATVATRFHELTRAALDGAELVKTLGDGVMVVAPDVATAVRLAEQLVNQVATQTEFPAIRIGIHRGGAVVRGGDYFGNSVNLTARVMEASKPGQVLCTEHVADAVTAAGLARTVPLGTVRLKHVVEPVALYELAFDSSIGPFKHVDPVCRMLVDASTTGATIEYEGILLHFCSEGCAERFAKSPDGYLSIVTSWRPPPPTKA